MKTYYVPKSMLFEEPEVAAKFITTADNEAGQSTFDEIVAVTTVRGSTITQEEIDALNTVFGYYNNQFDPAKRIQPSSANKGTLTEGGRLVLSAYRDARSEVEAACRNSPNVDILAHWTVQEFAENLLCSVIDWGYNNWYKDRSGKMACYFKPSSLFRGSKWRDRATWPDAPADPLEEDRW